MNAFLFVFALIGLQPTPTLLLLDMELKKAIRTTERFAVEDYLNYRFPVYAEDAPALSAAAEALAHGIDTGDACSDTVFAHRTTLYLHRRCADENTISVRMETRLSESKATFNFLLLDAEPSKRMAQRRLLDLATYLTQQNK